MERDWVALRDNILAVMAWAKIKFVHTAEYPRPCVYWREGAFTIDGGQAWGTYTPAEQYFVLLHEYAHVTRGDLRMKKVDHRRWNIAADAVINHSLQGLTEGALWETVITYDKLRAQYPALPVTIPTTRAIYEVLQEDADQSPDDYTPCGGDEKDDKAIIQATFRAILGAKQLPDGAKVCIEGSGWSLSEGPARALALPDVAACTQLMEILRLIRSKPVGYKQTRSYMREGRVASLRGVQRVPRPSVAVALDVSGSVSDGDIQRARNIAEYLHENGYTVRYVVWASSAAIWPGIGPLPAVGSTTDMRPAIALTQDDEVVVWLSDGLCASNPVEGQRHIWVGPASITQQPGEHVEWARG